jgi:hypothetical protein
MTVYSGGGLWGTGDLSGSQGVRGSNPLSSTKRESFGTSAIAKAFGAAAQRASPVVSVGSLMRGEQADDEVVVTVFGSLPLDFRSDDVYYAVRIDDEE